MVENDGRSLLVSEVPPGAAAPDRLQVTLEPSDSGAVPLGSVVLEWLGP